MKGWTNSRRFLLLLLAQAGFYPRHGEAGKRTKLRVRPRGGLVALGTVKGLRNCAITCSWGRPRSARPHEASLRRSRSRLNFAGVGSSCCNCKERAPPASAIHFSRFCTTSGQGKRKGILGRNHCHVGLVCSMRNCSIT